MEFKIYQHRLSALSARFNLMVTLVVLLLFSNLFLSALSFYLGFHQRVEVTPFFGSPRYSNGANGVFSASLCDINFYAY
jgi:conjugal transfer pilus assembly protein TraE